MPFDMASLIPYVESNVVELIALVTAVFMGWQVLAMRRQFKQDLAWRRRERAVKLTSHYVAEILPSIDVLEHISRNQGLGIKSSLKSRKVRTFKVAEANRIFGPTYLDEHNEILRNRIDNLPEHVICMVNSEMDRLNFNFEKELSLHEQIFYIEKKLLDKLEIFAAEVNLKLADNDIVFVQQNETFLTTIETLYPILCLENENRLGLRYKQIKKLFVSWRRRYIGLPVFPYFLPGLDDALDQEVEPGENGSKRIRKPLIIKLGA